MASDFNNAAALELEALIAKATDENLSDGGRYFADSYTDLTQCRHSEIGEYGRTSDGELIEWLWNHRRMIQTALAQPPVTPPPDHLAALTDAMEALAMCQPQSRHAAQCQQAAMIKARAIIANAKGAV